MRTSALRSAAQPALFALLLIGFTASSSFAQNVPGPFAWRTDYNAARKEASEKGFPLLIVVGSDHCFYCTKLERNTLRDPRVTGLIAGGFVPLKIDATRQPALAASLKVRAYPTIVLAGPDGKIHGYFEGYLEADRLAEYMKHTRALSVPAAHAKH